MPTEGVVAVKHYVVTAKKWEGGWELHIEGEGVTQSRTLDTADKQVRDYLETLHGKDFSDADLDVIPAIGPLVEMAREAREAVREAAKAQERAAKRSREVARELREEGLSVADTATVMGVSRGRVSQLVKS